MKSDKKFYLILVIAYIALFLKFSLQMGQYAQILIKISGILFSCVMFLGMIKTIRSGSYVVAIVTIIAITATIAVGEYWASLIVLIMLTAGDSLEDYAKKRL
ncbi:ATPase [Carnobacterium maltaromaticum]|uniref:ATPase n=1 Tax=Carnobacterium maltaromaticum TaxID=2751 RepID=UPI00295E6493|nr:ATPase [Carnobacterium maltaromaticum]